MSKSEARANAGRMGAAVREAKKEAAKYGNEVFLTEFGRLIKPDGEVVEMTADEYTEYCEAPKDAEPENAIDAAEIEWPVAKVEYEEATAPDSDFTVTIEPNDIVKVVDDPDSVLGWANHYKAMGLSDDEAMTLANRKMGATQSAEDQRREKGIEQWVKDNEATGPDPAVVAAYKERMKNYVPPKLDEKFEVTLPTRFADWVKRVAQWESALRRQEVSTGRALEIIVREHWHSHGSDRAILMGQSGGTGPTSTFNPITGNFEA